MRKHGTRSCYVGGCRCSDCSRVALAYARTHYRRTKPKSPKVSTAHVMYHIAYLKSYGLGCKAIGQACDCSPATIRLLSNGRLRTILRVTEQRILSVTPEAIADHALVDGDMTRKMLRELLDEGYSWRQLSRELKRTTLHVFYVKSVAAKTQLRVEKLYRRAMTVGLSDSVNAA